jgi:hypothetical protein
MHDKPRLQVDKVMCAERERERERERPREGTCVREGKWQGHWHISAHHGAPASAVAACMPAPAWQHGH